MKCPRCKYEISDKLLRGYIAGKLGAMSRRKITPEQQAKMQAARRAQKEAAQQ